MTLLASCSARGAFLVMATLAGTLRPRQPHSSLFHWRTTRQAHMLSGAGSFKLHLYDHCPYCTRVELVLGWRGHDYKRKVYGYADVKGPTDLIGRKVLPVFEWKDHMGRTQRMAESVDIINALESAPGPPGRVVAAKTGRKDLKAWQQSLRKVMHSLTRPRLLQMPIDDFKTAEDKLYQMNKYVSRGFDYNKAMDNTEQVLPKVNNLLEKFPDLLKGDLSLNKDGWSWDDLYVLPSLRVLSCVKDLQWPSQTRNYLEAAHAAAGVGLYFDYAC
eukprot:TRINITY_DN78987_c0_g1_i1.p1 TRINITY_DN78987_c0_g1~~TRINITY_DN78987_c0_g1_i1.p1  ORF type:complete len:273 (-),score=35.69 TRINITY_DN78987_c0_g1_i1:115-933(-)